MHVIYEWDSKQAFMGIFCKIGNILIAKSFSNPWQLTSLAIHSCVVLPRLLIDASTQYIPFEECYIYYDSNLLYLPVIFTQVYSEDFHLW